MQEEKKEVKELHFAPSPKITRVNFLNYEMKERNLSKSVPLFLVPPRRVVIRKSKSDPFLHSWEFFPEFPSTPS